MFDAGLIAVMRGALEQATLDVRPDPSTQALMAERILQSAASGTRSQETFRIVATEAAADSERLRVLNPLHSRHMDQDPVDLEEGKEFW